MGAIDRRSRHMTAVQRGPGTLGRRHQCVVKGYMISRNGASTVEDSKSIWSSMNAGSLFWCIMCMILPCRTLEGHAVVVTVHVCCPQRTEIPVVIVPKSKPEVFCIDAA